MDFTSFLRNSSTFVYFELVDIFRPVDDFVVWTKTGLSWAVALTLTFHFGLEVDLERSNFFVDFENLRSFLIDWVKVYILFL